MSKTMRDNTRVQRRGVRGAFTLVEIIVAIGLLAVVSVLVGTIFASVGDTVTTGRQVSNLNRFAARVERVMRRDFDNMVRENGFMVIRNELTNTYSSDPDRLSVALTATDQSFPADDDGDGNEEPGRPRRIDELMFFSRGDFTSRRTPLHRDLVARADTARVYYGHGQRRVPSYRFDSSAEPTSYELPRLDDVNADQQARLGSPSSLGTANPNEYASDWSLLRHVTLLVPRPGGLQLLPDTVFGIEPNADGTDGLEAYNRVADGSRQIALSPAAQSVFRGLTQLSPLEVSDHPLSTDLIERGVDGFGIRPSTGYSYLLNGFDEDSTNDAADETLVRPHFGSGIVDIAVTSLDEIRGTVTNTWYDQSVLSSGSPSYVERGPTSITPFDYSATADALDLRQQHVSYDNEGRRLVGTPLITINTADYYGGTLNPVPQTQQLWMLDALPSTPLVPGQSSETGYRVRYEPAPPQMFLDDGAGGLDDEGRLEIALRQADQEMLSASVFLPRCTEFIVEWSLGIIDRRDPDNNPNYGRPIWHGLRRFEDRDGTGAYEAGFGPGSDVLHADIFGLISGGAPTYGGDQLVDDPAQTNNEFAIREPVGTWIIEDGNVPGFATQGAIDLEMIELVRLDQRFDLSSGDPDEAVIAEYAFGYQYQDWNGDSDGDNTFDNDDDDVSRPWPWPRLIRVTMRFVDPSDPELERTYQAEFRVPVPRGEI